ncbi:patatin-like phospholipase family protein [Neptunomonas phycophila]|jgi:NTE family protein|uniref:Patatin-like phospholipase family protein n=1 Tax=Neptunomonas phycophila TaxID=1572645 RepID=A0ABT9EY60_9GAMM|nr:patatin-like phospholipase family protein [Neptunomonas phycophila]MDO6469638.1 patatin-like phospholipase family protein [Neptunomonas phycophila]MDP2523985.1 patatin-like phospholipase family protein [Neptunomonas phycophila]
MKTRTINLALQGGGAHGAFTWGVLDRLLDEPWLDFEGVTGTSAGAMNAVMLAEGWRKDGRAGAKEQLSAFWGAVSSKGFGLLLPEGVESSLTRWWLHTMQYISPYDINMLDINPLRDMLSGLVNFEALSKESPFSLYIAATAVRSGKLALFRESVLSVNHLLASACLPKIHKAIEIDGEYYWDGGFAGNPAIFPLIYDCSSKDILIVLLQTLDLDALPTGAEAIAERVTELGFQAHFMREMRAIAEFRENVSFGFVPGTKAWKLQKMRLHILQNQAYLSSLDQASKYNTRKGFLEALFLAGQSTAEQWLSQHQNDIGRRASCDISALFGA